MKYTSSVSQKELLLAFIGFIYFTEQNKISCIYESSKSKLF